MHEREWEEDCGGTGWIECLCDEEDCTDVKQCTGCVECHEQLEEAATYEMH